MLQDVEPRETTPDSWRQTAAIWQELYRLDCAITALAERVQEPPDPFAATAELEGRVSRLRRVAAQLEGVIGILPGLPGDRARESMRYIRETYTEPGDLGGES